METTDQDFFSASSALFCIINKEGKILQFKGGWHYLGYDVQQTPEISFIELFQLADRATIQRAIEQLKQQELVIVEGRIRAQQTKQNEGFLPILWQLNYKTGYYYCTGIHISNYMQQQTKYLQQSEQSSTETQQYLQQILNNMSDAALLFSEETLQICTSNPAATQLCGYTANEWQHLTIDEITPKGLEKLRIWQTALQRHYYDVAAAVKHKDGTQVPVKITTFNLTQNGQNFIVVLLQKQTQHYFGALFKSFPIPISLTNFKGQFIEINKKFQEFFGYNPEQIESLSFNYLFAEEQRENIQQLHKQLLIKDTLTPVETLVLRKDKQTHPTRLLSVKIKTAELSEPLIISVYLEPLAFPTPKANVATPTPITTKENIQELLEKIPLLLMGFNQQQQIVLWNHRSEIMTGYSHLEMQKQGLSLLHFTAEERQAAIQLYKQKHVTPFKTQIKCQDGVKKTIQWFDISESCFLEHIENCFLGEIVEAEDQKKNYMIEFSVMLKTVLENMPFAIAVTDENGRFILCNQEYSQLHGYSSEQLLNRPFITLFPSNAHASLLRQYFGFLNNDKQDFFKENRVIQHRLGKLIQIEVMARRTHPTVDKTYVVWTVTKQSETIAA